MAYNRRNLLLRVLEIQEVYTLKKLPESTHVGVWREYIYPTFKISLKTLENYLSIPAKAELKKMDNAQKDKNKVQQISMEFVCHDDSGHGGAGAGEELGGGDIGNRRAI